MRRLVFAACILAVISAGCAEQQLGRRIVECDGPTQALGTSVILTAQAVPGTEYIPCVDALRPGWQFEHVQARSGQAYFTLDSDRMGLEFLRVTLLPSCDIGAATEVRSDERDVTLSVEVLEETAEFTVVVIPVADRHYDYAQWMAARLLSEEINGREIVATIDESDRPMSEKVSTAHATGSPVIIIDDAEADTETLSLRRVGDEEEPGLDFDAALAEISDDVDDPVYKARWFYTFQGGCIRYDIDAEGEGAQSVKTDVARAIGLYPMEELYELARQAGYRGFE
jgi:hypothetical protein